MPAAVAIMDLGEPLSDWHELAVRASGRVTVGQHAGKHIRRRLELVAQDVSKPAFASFDDGAGVMGDQPAQQGVGALGAVEGVQARDGHAGRVADVVQPRGFQEIGVRAENGCQAACPRGNAPDVRPPAGRPSWRSAWPICSAHEASVFMQPRLAL